MRVARCGHIPTTSNSCSSLIIAALLAQHPITWPAGGPCGLPPHTARLAIASVPRGIGLLQSAFGLVVLHDTHAALVGHLDALTARLPASFDELGPDLVHVCVAGALEAPQPHESLPATRPSPRHLIVSGPDALQCGGIMLHDERAVAEALLEVREAGGRAVPLQPAEVAGQPEREFTAAWRAMGRQARARCCAKRRELLRSYGGAYARLADVQHGTLTARVVDAPDLEL